MTILHQNYGINEGISIIISYVVNIAIMFISLSRQDLALACRSILHTVKLWSSCTDNKILYDKILTIE